MNIPFKEIACCFLFIFSSMTFAVPPDFTKGDSKPKPGTHDWNLGPTGLRGWIYSHRLETSEARQIYITKVDAASPASGILKEGDVILGVAGKRFSYDPRVEFGKAVTNAEAQTGQLSLMVWRAGKTQNVRLKIQVLGSYSNTAPFTCSKSKMIFDRGCEALFKKMQSGKTRGNWITKSFNALALLSSGKKEYLPLIKIRVKEASDYIVKSQGAPRSWYYGPINILVAEYILATGDKSYLPLLEAITMKIVNGQSKVSS